MYVENFKDLIVWQKSMSLADQVYELTDFYPDHERYGLISQMRRCAVSIPSNIAEGRRRGTRKDYRQFLRIALGSTAELETQLLLSKKRQLIPVNESQPIFDLLTEIIKMLSTMVSRL